MGQQSRKEETLCKSTVKFFGGVSGIRLSGVCLSGSGGRVTVEGEWFSKCTRGAEL